MSLFLNKLKLFFSKINDDGKIDKSEMTKLYVAIGELKGTDKDRAKEEVAAVLKKFDVDNSGSLNKAEFISAVHGNDVFSLFNN